LTNRKQRRSIYRTRDLLARQRTQTINALRDHLADQGIFAPAGPAFVGRLAVSSMAIIVRCLRRCGTWRDRSWTRLQL